MAFFDPDSYESEYHHQYQHQQPSAYASGGRSYEDPRRMPRSRTHTAGSSSEGSTASDTEFLSYETHEAPRVAGHEYGPYSHLNYAQGLEMERQRSDESHKYASSQGSHQSGSSGSGGQHRQHNRTGSISARGGVAYAVAGTGYSGSPALSTGPGGMSGMTETVEIINRPYYTANVASEAHFLYDTKEAEQDDFMHNPSPHDDIVDKRTCTILSLRGFLNVFALLVILLGLIGMFGAYPIIDQITKLQASTNGAWNLGGTNATGQVPVIKGLPSLIDGHTPQSAMTRSGFDGKQYNLVFSDEFEVEGRTFWPGDDPFWEAVDLHYHATGDREWYDPDAVTTKNGSMVITISEQPIHDLSYRSGMVQSWNKMCFQGGYIEVKVQLPGTSTVGGFWPGAWTMGNLARAGYGATSDGVWPFSYDSCDVGTRPNQTNADGTPTAAAGLSYQPGQRLSACTCKGEDHPGPNNQVGRGAPEIDLLEAQIQTHNGVKGGEVSQSAQIAPYDNQYGWNQQSPATSIQDPSKTWINSYLGGVYQEAVSALTSLDDQNYQDQGGFGTYGYEYQTGGDDDSYITWTYNGDETWTVRAASFGPNPTTQISQRLISEEPMYMILNLALADSFQTIEFGSLQFPAKMLIEYVRVYQRDGETKVGCDPDDHPTANYINEHLNSYTNPNLTTWADAGYEFPKQRLVDGC